MKRMLVAGTVVGALALAAGGRAFAADLPPAPMPPPRAPAVYVPAVIPVYNWTGCYVGANAGGVWRAIQLLSHLLIRPVAPGALPQRCGLARFRTVLAYDRASWLAGGQVGCNFQFSAFVVGAETTLTAPGLTKARPSIRPCPRFLRQRPVSTRRWLDWTTRARAGRPLTTSWST